MKSKAIFFSTLSILLTAQISLAGEVSRGTRSCDIVLSPKEKLEKSEVLHLPLNPTRPEILKSFLDLNPLLNEKQIEQKISDCQSAFFLLRSFVTSFYQELTQNISMSSELRQAQKHIGWMFGDAHPENFGMLISEEGKSRFTMNDYDDNAFAPVVWDLMRFLTAARLNNPDEDLSKIIASYRLGLSGDKIELPRGLVALKDESEKAGRVPQASALDEKGELLARSEVTEELPSKLRDQMDEALKNAYGKKYGKMIDGLIVNRTQGGSGGLARYHALIKLADKTGSDSKLVLIEFKQMTDASPKKFSSELQPKESKRIQISLDITQKGKASHFYSVQEVGKLTMLMRPRFAGNKGVALVNFKGQDQSELIRAEAAVLGYLHARSLENVKKYQMNLAQVKDDELIQLSHSIANHFEALFQTLKVK